MSLAAPVGRASPMTIILEDDESDVQSSATSARHIESRTPMPTLQLMDDPLELRLGPLAPSTPRVLGEIGTHTDTTSRVPESDIPPELAFSLTSGQHDGDSEVTNKRRKRVQVSTSDEPDYGREFKLTCSICLDTMKEETSTICGHVFCKACISGALQIRFACPSCRRRLTIKDIHRVYIH